MDSVELLDLSRLISDDEETWLFAPTHGARSYQAKHQFASSVSKWTREEFEALRHSNKLLLHQLDYVMKNERLKNCHKPVSTTPLQLTTTPLQPMLLTSSPAGNINISNEINTKTFTRPKKSTDRKAILGRIADALSREVDHPGVQNGTSMPSQGHSSHSQETPMSENDGNGYGPVSQSVVKPSATRVKRALFHSGSNDTILDKNGAVGTDSVRCNGGEAMTDCMSNDSNGWDEEIGSPGRRLSEVADVQNLARFQEESLRKQCLSSALAMRSRKDLDGKLRQRSLPNLCDGVKLSLSAGDDLDDVNISSAPNSRGHGSSPTTSCDLSPPQSNGGPKTMKSPAAEQNSNGHVSVRSESPTIALQKSGIPLPRSAIPRPGSTSKLPAQSRSGLQPPSSARRNTSSVVKQSDNSWREGCY